VHRGTRAKWQLRLVNASFIALFLAAVALLQSISREHVWRFDLTQNRRYSLSPASIAAIERLQGPVTVTVYASQRGDTRPVVRDVIARYQEHKPDIRLEFVDPDTEPERVRSAGIQYDGELVVAHGDARENVPPTALTEENLTNAFTRLGHRGERWLVFLSGHGERSPERQANFDLSTWARQLQKRGFKTRSLALGDNPTIPQNTSVLVIAGPRARLLAGEIKAIEDYLKRGGSLLWLTDPGAQHGLERIGEALGIEVQPGTVVDPNARVLTGNAAILVAKLQGAHPIVREFDQVTVFPNVAGLSVRAVDGWKSQVLLDTRANAWLETGRLDDEPRFDKGKDVAGPIAFGFALARALDGREQRVVAIGDGDFLSNQFVGNGGNVELGIGITNWLSRDDAYVSIPARTARDRRLELSYGARRAMGTGFFLALPLALAAAGAAVWWRRRKR
jgi:ABC-type uncharacterized transport system involved in gliding motility auxiliary subunit